MYSLVAAGINHSGICRSFSSHNLTTIFIDGGAYGISVDGLPGITIFSIRSSFRASIHNCVGCQCAGFDGLPALLINDGTRCNPAFMYPLLTAVQSGIHCLPLKALSSSGTDNRV